MGDSSENRLATNPRRTGETRYPRGRGRRGRRRQPPPRLPRLRSGTHSHERWCRWQPAWKIGTKTARPAPHRLATHLVVPGKPGTHGAGVGAVDADNPHLVFPDSDRGPIFMSSGAGGNRHGKLVRKQPVQPRIVLPPNPSYRGHPVPTPHLFFRAKPRNLKRPSHKHSHVHQLLPSTHPVVPGMPGTHGGARSWARSTCATSYRRATPHRPFSSPRAAPTRPQ